MVEFVAAPLARTSISILPSAMTFRSSTVVTVSPPRIFASDTFFCTFTVSAAAICTLPSEVFAFCLPAVSDLPSPLFTLLVPLPARLLAPFAAWSAFLSEAPSEPSPSDAEPLVLSALAPFAPERLRDFVLTCELDFTLMF